jgi:large subunit ribosomal protein L15
MRKYFPDHFEKRRFTSRKPPTTNINVGELQEKMEEWITVQKAVESKEGIIIDLSNLGYEKLLGSGRIDQPLIIKIKAFSKRAAEKIVAAGGRITK